MSPPSQPSEWKLIPVELQQPEQCDTELVKDVQHYITLAFSMSISELICDCNM